MAKITILVASEGMNRQLADIIQEESREHGITAEIIELASLDLPIYTEKEEQGGIPFSATRLLKRVKESDALIVVAPEYNGGMPPVLSNAICWVSRASRNWRDAFEGKPVALATHSGSGGHHIVMAMRNQFSFLGANVLGKALVTSYEKILSRDKLESILTQLADLCNWHYDPVSMIKEDINTEFEASY